MTRGHCKGTGKAISMPQFVIDGTGADIGNREVL